MHKEYIELLTVLNLRESYVHNTFGARTVQRGLDYFHKDFVRIIDVLSEDDGTIEIHSEVTGSSGKIYETTVSILPSSWKKNASSRIRIESDCSCPVGFQCKHGLASVLEFAQFVIDSDKSKLSNNSKSTPSSAVDLWLNDLQTITEHKPSVQHTQEPEFSQYQLFYILTPDSDIGNSIKVETYKVKQLKRGGYGKLIKQDLNYILMGFQYDEFYYNNIDKEVAKLLVDKVNSGSYFYNESKNNKYDIEGDVGQLALNKILQTHRAYWKSYDSIDTKENEINNKPLKPGELRKVNLQWQDTQGDYRLISNIQPSVDEIFHINDLYYIDKKNNKVGKLENNHLNTEQIIKLLSAPAIPKDEAEKVSLQLLQIWPNADIPMPVDLGIEEVDISNSQPTPDVFLHSFQVTDYTSNSGKQRIHQLSLRFDYKGQVIQPETEQSPFINIKGHTRYHIKRDLKAEKLFIDKLKALHFSPLYETGNFEADLELQEQIVI